jgi:hypothetical protein
VRHTTLFALMAGMLSAVNAQLPDASRFDSFSKDSTTRTTGTNLPSDRSSVFQGRSGTADYSANRRIGGIVVEVERNGLPADGQTANKIVVKLLDAKGAPLTGEALVTIEITGGRVLLPGARTDEYGPDRKDVDAVVPGVQLQVKDGMAEFVLLAPSEPKDVRIRVSGGEYEASGVVSYLPDLREWVAAGVIDGIINFRKSGASSFLQARPEDGFEREMRHWQNTFSNGKNSAGVRTSFFLKGKISGEYLLTAAYDSDKETRRKLAETVRPEEFYPVYGDSALRGSDVRSASRLFVRVDNGKSYGLFGDFSTATEAPSFTSGTGAGLKLRDLGAYSRNLTGLKWHYETTSAALNVFAARDNLKQIIDEFQGQGVSGPYALSNNGALIGTERVELIVRDRNQRSVILSTTLMAPLADYSFEPFSGRLLFKQPVPAFDSNLNPIFVRVTYELEQDGPSFWLAGVDGQVKVSESVELGGSYVKDNNPQGKYSLASANLGVRLGAKTMMAVEIASSRGDINTTTSNINTAPGVVGRAGTVSGRAARAEIRHEGIDWSLRAFAGRSDTDFINPAASLNGGRTEAGIKADYKISEPITLYGQLVRSEDRVTTASRSAGDVGVRIKVSDALELDLGLRSVKESRADPDAKPAVGTGLGVGNSTVGGGFFGIGNNTGNNGVINNGGFTDTSSGAAPVNSNSARIGLKWKATDSWTVLGELEADISGANKRRVSLGVDYQLTERSKVYARFENQNGLASVLSANPADKSRAFILGVSSSFLANTEVFTEYRLRDAVSGDSAAAKDLQLASGIQRVINAAPGLRYTVSAEHLKVLSGSSRAALAVAGGVDYTADELWKLGGKLEYRRVADDANTPVNDRQDTWLSTVSVARKLDRDWTGLVRNYLLYSDDKALPGSRTQDRLQIGAAYRPVDTNRFDALVKVEYKLDRNGELTTGPERTRTTIGSVHANYHPTRAWWLGGRFAAKSQKDPYGNYTAYLIGGRATWDFAESWDASLLTSFKWSPNGSTRQWAQGVEIGYAIQQNLWLSVGANWAGFSDKELAGADYTNRGVYIRLRFKFDEDLFRGSEARSNRSIARDGQTP